jgi:hypothetical protein
MLAVMRPAAALTIAGLAAACGDPAAAARQRGTALLASGFTTQPFAAASPDMQPMPGFSRQTGMAGPVFLTADPLACRCMYRGDLAAYTRYEIGATEQRQANDAATGAVLSQRAEQQWQALWPGLGL